MRKAFSAIAFLVCSLMLSPAEAGGLLQDLFSPSPAPTPVAYYYAPAQPHFRFPYDEGLRVWRRPHAARKAAPGRAAVRQGVAPARHGSAARKQARRVQPDKGRRVAVRMDPRGGLPTPPQPARAQASIETPASIQEDRTLRVGDAYMTPQGLRIYRGAAAHSADRKAFVELRRAALDRAAKARLAELETRSRGDFAPIVVKPTARPAATSAARRTSIDREGRTIRVVGP